ncbi:demethylmenaquinone methyltransferase [Fictibacillus aquaticus]|uniref:Demethylmenaquinone methyltransferase n=1 Tax=Fictibacillus aquaticus TaxID=2021314 RepID=A0A235FB01_9BACL|nr:demethylmenaquinone methyltransferase [Fictibacillus aquaticus]OYD58521.1 bifunctional demethylmenaquinone methyltransferase/2-methoxy-6-polyprenyl-1,4-benzoquinol methylase [Fictibacillus aquaticus]
MMSKEERVHSVFEKISTQYDFMNDVISFRQHVRWRSQTMRIIEVKEGSRCLDLCCGTADWTIALAGASGPGGAVTGLDFSENMLSAGRKKVEEKGLESRIDLLHGNAMELPFADDTFDVVTIGFGLRNVPDYLQVVREMARVVKPGGKVVCLETSQPSAPVFRHLFSFYFTSIMPLFGKLFAKSYDEYAWLQESTKAFLSKEELKQLFYEAGLEKVMVKSFSLGAAAMHYGRKPS